MALAHAIFPSFELQTMRGYDLKKFFDMLVVHFWTTTQNHIHKTLTYLEQDRRVEKKFIERDDKPNHTEYLIIKTGHADLHLRTTASLNTQIKLAEDLGWSKYNSERSWTVLDKLFRLAQVVDKHLAPVAQRWPLQRCPSS
jgi:DNA-binding PadR family transcriptional regulator